MGAIGDHFVFVQIPKTAGTSLATALCSNGAKRTSACADLVNACMHNTIVKAANHLRARDLLQYFGEAEWRRRFTFGVVRNPWDRLVSMYEFIRGKEDHPQHRALATQSFDQYVRKAAGRRNSMLWLDDENGTQLVDAVYRFENLRESYSEILERCGLRPDTKLPHINTSSRTHYRSYFDDELASLVANRCAHEIQRYGYNF